MTRLTKHRQTLHSVSRISAALLALAFSCAEAAPALTPGSNSTRLHYVPGEILVKFKPTSSPLMRQQSLAAFARHDAQTLSSDGLVRVRLAPGETVDTAITAHAGDPAIEYAQPNFIYHTLNTPADTFYSQMWGLNNTAQTVATGSYATNNPPPVAGSDIDAQSAWDLNTDCSTMTVAVVDTGINYNHDDLSANMWDGGVSYPNHGYDFIANDNDPMDLNGHGSHVAGTIGAQGNNALGSTGICWNASLMAVRVLDAAGYGTTLGITQGINFAVANGARVINMSLGGGGFDALMNSAISNARDNNVVVVVAAGNDNSDNDLTPAYPCSYTQDNLICVAALDQGFARASFSNYGASSVDVGAPGTNTLSTWPLNDGIRVFLDNFSTGNTNWSFEPTTDIWAVTQQTYGNPTNVMSDPSGFENNYASNKDYTAYRNFNFTGADVAVLEYEADFSVRDVGDSFNLVYSASGVPSTVIEGFENTSTDLSLIYLANEVPGSCMGGSCNLGFNLHSDADGITDFGVELGAVALTTYAFNNSRYNTINGTSMATPHAAGIAALVWSYNPSFSYREVVNAVKYGGVNVSALDGISSTGKAVNARGALVYINPPTGVTAVVQ